MTAAISLTAPPEPSTIGPLTLTHFVVYQGASGDLAAIHHDPDVARAAGYDQPFAPGMYAAGVLASWAAAWMGGRNIRRYRVRFANMVWPGDILTSSGRIVSTTVKDDVTVVELELVCRSQTQVVVNGWATFEIPSADVSL